jgi:hypothetical protein
MTSISRLIRKIERILAIAENTSLQLEKGISLVIDVVGSMTRITDIWADTVVSVEIAQDNFKAWWVAMLCL